MERKQKKSARSIAKPRLVIAIAVAIVLLYILCARIFHTWPLRKAVAPASTAQTTSTAPSAQDNFKGDDKPIPRSTSKPNASGTDQGGSSGSQIPAQTAWTTSKDGSSIVIYGPAKNSIFTSGSSVFGTASSSTVSYRLSDAVSGLLTSGTAKVVDGGFSIRLSFSTSASTGNIEIFNQQDPYSPESNNVLVPVRFK